MSELRDSVKAAYDQVVNDEKPEIKIVEEAPQELEKEVSTHDTPVTPETPQEPEIEAPIHWASEDREVFKALDQKGRQFLLRRHKEMEASHTKKMQEHADKIKSADEFSKVIEPHRDYIKKIGFDPMEAVNKLISAEIKLRMGSAPEKVAILKNLAQQYGVQFNNSDTDPEIDEKTQLIIQELQEHKSAIMEFKHEKEEAEKRVLINHINEFSSKKDDKGNLLYPHFETLKTEMGFLLENGKALSMEDAYEQAIFLNKDLRSEWVLRQNKTIEPTVKKTVSSKDANFNVKSVANAKMSESKPNEDLRQTLKRAMAAQKNRI